MGISKNLLRFLVTSYRMRIISFVMLLLIIGVSFAHYPVFAPEGINGFESALLIKNAETSWGIYAKLEKGRVDYYKFEVKEPLDFYVNILVPYTKSNKEFVPSFALLGPGLGEPDRDFPIKNLLRGYGVLEFNPKTLDYTEIIYESFTDTRYLKGMEYETKLDREGVYYAVVYSVDAEEFGDYVLVVGNEDRYNIFDLFYFVFSYFRIKWLFWLG